MPSSLTHGSERAIEAGKAASTLAPLRVLRPGRGKSSAKARHARLRDGEDHWPAQDATSVPSTSSAPPDAAAASNDESVAARRRATPPGHAAILACQRATQAAGRQQLPVMISGTARCRSGPDVMKADQWQLASSLLSSVPEMKLKPDVISYNSAISYMSACENGGQWQAALGLLRRQMSLPTVPPLPPAQEEARGWATGTASAQRHAGGEDGPRCCHLQRLRSAFERGSRLQQALHLLADVAGTLDCTASTTSGKLLQIQKQVLTLFRLLCRVVSFLCWLCVACWILGLGPLATHQQEISGREEMRGM
ncbi:unnamed protein product [Polarella glacialis]|uniref:Uncharacterized protein n=1 Tax=Polarella glacialis TaxID=89957 RepID=A0A813JPN4_POLGL|nr:unnamed protein product [Polarella glacialis]